MCYTNSLYIKLKKLAKTYDLPEDAGPEFEPISKASGFDFPEWPVLTTRHPQKFVLANWGLVPSWVKDRQQADKIRASTLNARAETLTEKPSFKHAALHRQRCVIPSTGFFEWQTIGKKKYPYFISLANRKVLSMAGLWEERINDAGHSELTFTIVTVPANSLMEKIHNTKKKMPAILTEDGIQGWLQTTTTDTELAKILAPIDEKLMEAHTIRPLNSTSDKLGFDSLIEPFEYPELSRQLNLF